MNGKMTRLRCRRVIFSLLRNRSRDILDREVSLMKKRILALLLALLTALSLFACGKKPQAPVAEPDPPIQQGQTVEVTDPIVADDPTDTPATQEDPTLDESGTYTSKEDVALYIHLYGHLPDNFITKKEAQAMGWTGGSLEPYAPGKCIGGSRFGNYEGALPDAPGRKYTECDIDTLDANGRGAKRIVFSNDGLIYYTEDHYKTFELLYGEGEG